MLKKILLFVFYLSFFSGCVMVEGDTSATVTSGNLYHYKSKRDKSSQVLNSYLHAVRRPVLVCIGSYRKQADHRYYEMLTQTVNQFSGAMLIAKADILQTGDWVESRKIQNVPTIIVIDKGIEVARCERRLNDEEILQFVNEVYITFCSDGYDSYDYE